ncbi:uncharacterized protein LOC105663896 isoform X2 [Megachile rotundata]|uniref:uncharacterized protein LOC105663896 isoform X2 n=1 Tax=Megachile rotundata TaxID=143995 RepID=UPI003FD549A1
MPLPRWILDPPSGSSLVQWWRSPPPSDVGPFSWLWSTLSRVVVEAPPRRGNVTLNIFCAAMVCVVVILARRSSKYCTNVRGAGLVANSEGMLALVPKTNSCGENPVASCTEVLYEKMQNLTQSSQSVFVQYIFRFYRSVSLYD